MSDKPQRNRKPTEEGVYKGEITGQRFGVTPNGASFFEVDIRLTARQMPDYTHQSLPVPINRSASLYITEGTMAAGVVQKQLRALGWEGTDFEELEPSSKKFVPLAGNECQFLCKHDKKEDKTYENWEVFSPKAKERPPSDGAVAKKLNTLFKSSMTPVAKSAKPANAKPKTPPKEAPSEEPEETTDNDDDDVPY